MRAIEEIGQTKDLNHIELAPDEAILSEVSFTTDPNAYNELMRQKADDIRLVNQSENVDELISSLLDSGYVPSDFEMPEVY